MMSRDKRFVLGYEGSIDDVLYVCDETLVHRLCSPSATDHLALCAPSFLPQSAADPSSAPYLSPASPARSEFSVTALHLHAGAKRSDGVADAAKAQAQEVRAVKPPPEAMVGLG